MKVTIEEILEMQQRRSEINSIDIKDIEWYENGVKIEVHSESLDEWRFTGLSNTDFIFYMLPELDLHK